MGWQGKHVPAAPTGRRCLYARPARPCSTAFLSAKLMRIGSALLVVALASIGLTLWVTRQLEGWGRSGERSGPHAHANPGG